MPELDFEVQVPTKEELSQLTKLVTRMLELQLQIEDQNQSLRVLQDSLKQIQEVSIPEMMAEIGMKEFKLQNGMMLTIKEDIHPSIRKDFIAKAIMWLDEKGLGDIVKREVKVKFGRGDKDAALKLINFCKENKLPSEENASVHPQTLKATIKSQMKKGIEFPEEYFSIAQTKQAVIKK